MLSYQKISVVDTYLKYKKYKKNLFKNYINFILVLLKQIQNVPCPLFKLLSSREYTPHLRQVLSTHQHNNKKYPNNNNNIIIKINNKKD